MRLKLLFMLLLFCASASALDFHAFIEPTAQTIHLNSSGTFDLEIRSNVPADAEFEVFTPDINWDVIVERPLIVSAKDNVTKALTIAPSQNINPGKYMLPVLIRQVGGNTIRKIIDIDVREPSKTGGSYVPSVRGTLHIDPKVDPRSAVEVKLVLENQNKRKLDDVEVKLRSDTINNDYKVSLSPLEERTLIYEISLDPATRPAADMLQAHVIVNADKEYQFDLIPTPFDVIAYGNVVENVTESSALFTKDIGVVLLNEGNHKIRHVFSVPVSWFSKWFVSSTLEGQELKKSIQWDVELEPSESVEFSVAFDYWPAVWISLIVVIAVFLYFKFRSPVVVRKKAKVVRTREEGISELKVVIHVRNRTNNLVKSAKLMDLVPHMAKMVEPPAHGIKPTKIVPHEHRGALVSWDIGDITGKEERVLTYNAKCKFTVLGSMTLPVAVAKFVYTGRYRQAVSNHARISVE